MRKFLVAIVLGAGIFGLTGVAAADFIGPTGSDFDGADVTCGGAADNFLQEPVEIYNGPRGLEVCADGGLGPIQGRVFLDSNETPPIYLPDRIHGDMDRDTPILGGSGHFLDIDFPF